MSAPSKSRTRMPVELAKALGLFDDGGSVRLHMDDDDHDGRSVASASRSSRTSRSSRSSTIRSSRSAAYSNKLMMRRAPQPARRMPVGARGVTAAATAATAATAASGDTEMTRTDRKRNLTLAGDCIYGCGEMKVVAYNKWRPSSEQSCRRSVAGGAGGDYGRRTRDGNLLDVYLSQKGFR